MWGVGADVPATAANGIARKSVTRMLFFMVIRRTERQLEGG
jgi:hypothetical protein